MEQNNYIGPVFRNRIFFTLLIFWAAISSVSAYQPERGIDVRSIGSDHLISAPGKILTVSFAVTNTTGSRQRYSPQLILPGGWRAAMQPPVFELDGQGSDISLISFSIPPEMPAADYPVRFRLTDGASPSHVGEAVLMISVTEIRRIEIQTIDVPQYVVGGEKIVAHFSLTNKGNAPSTIRLKSSSVAIDSAHIDSAVVHLRPNEMRTIVATGYTSDTLSQKVQTVIQVTATLAIDTTVSKSAYALAQVVPNVSSVVDNMFYYPLIIKARMVGSRTAYGPQIELYGSGPLGDGRRDRLELLVRAPESMTRSYLGELDEYRIKYHSDALDVYAGDMNYTLSPLTEFGRFGFGAGGRVTVSGLTAGGFYDETRFSFEKQKETAGFLAYEFRPEIYIGANFLSKNDEQRSKIMSFRSIVQPIRNTTVDIEYGHGWTPQVDDDAYMGKINGETTRFSYGVWYMHAGPNYPGYYNNLNSIVGNFSVSVSRQIRIEGYFRDEQRNLNRDTALFNAPKEQYCQFGISFSSYLALYYHFDIQKDLLPNPSYNNREDILQIQTGYNFGAAGFFVYADLGQSQNRLSSQRSFDQRYTLSTNVQPFSSQNYGLSVQYAKGQNIYTGQPEELVSGNLNAAISFSDRTYLLLNGYTSRTLTTTAVTYNTIDGIFNHTFPWKHRIALHGRANFYTSTHTRDYAYLLEYAVPLNIPIGRTLKAGALAGRIVDTETGQGIARAVISVGGSTAITDEQGKYQFPVFSPDTYYLQVDKSSIGFNKVTTQTMPLEVAIRGGDVTHIDIGVVRSATLTGTILLYGFDSTKAVTDPPSYIELHGQNDIVLEITNGTELYRRVSDIHGRFVFNELRPGRWTLTVPEGQLPQYHKLEKEKWEFDFKPGKKDDVTLKILPQRRAIRIIQEGNVIEEKPARYGVKKQQKQKLIPGPETVSYYPIIYREDKHGYVVQVSSWRMKYKAVRDVRTIKQTLGLTPFIEKITLPQIGTRYRVYIGTYKTEAEAEAIVARLKTMQ